VTDCIAMARIQTKKKSMMSYHMWHCLRVHQKTVLSRFFYFFFLGKLNNKSRVKNQFFQIIGLKFND
jgi:hypothetical protein